MTINSAAIEQAAASAATRRRYHHRARARGPVPGLQGPAVDRKPGTLARLSRVDRVIRISFPNSSGPLKSLRLFVDQSDTKHGDPLISRVCRLPYLEAKITAGSSPCTLPPLLARASACAETLWKTFHRTTRPSSVQMSLHGRCGGAQTKDPADGRMSWTHALCLLTRRELVLSMCSSVRPCSSALAKAIFVTPGACRLVPEKRGGSAGEAGPTRAKASRGSSPGVAVLASEGLDEIDEDSFYFGKYRTDQQAGIVVMFLVTRCRYGSSTDFVYMYDGRSVSAKHSKRTT